MKQDDKLINAIIDLSQEIKGMRKDMNHQLGELNLKVDGLNHRVDKLEKQFEKMEKHQQRTNMELGEIRLTFMQHADTIQKVTDHEKRIYKLERK